MGWLSGTAFYWLDIAVGVAIPVVVVGLVATDRAKAVYGRGFLLGCVLGLCWELPMHFQGPLYTETPLFEYATAWPLHPLTQPFVHALWDGGLFVTGLWLAATVCGPAMLRSVRGRALAVLTVWGLGTEMVVEWLAAGRGWTWIPRWYNPTLCTVRGDPVTLLPLLVWLVAPAVFYVGLVGVVEQRIDG